MSEGSNRKVMSAYEQMLEDGSAFEKVDMTMNEMPDMSMAMGAEIPESKSTPSRKGLEEDNTDFSDIDKRMMERMNSLKTKVRKKNSAVDESSEIRKLKLRVKRLEEALVLIMETHEKLL